MALNPSGAISLSGPSTGQSIAVELGLSPTVQISLNDTNVRTLAQVPSGSIVMPVNFWGKSAQTNTQQAIFGYGAGASPVRYSITNKVSNTGIVSGDTAGVGTARFDLGAATYGGDKAIFAFGSLGVNISNLISNTGVIASDSPGVGTGRRSLTQAPFGGDKGIMCWGNVSPSLAYSTATNQISNTGVVAADVNTPGGLAGGLRAFAGGCGYGGDKGIMAYGFANPARLNTKNLVSNTAVLTTNLPGIGTARSGVAAAGFSST